MKKVDDATANDNASGNGWFKIWESGYDESDGRWCTEKMIDNTGHVSATVPSDIQAGYYLVRPELLALHAAADSPPDPQLYVGCAQIFVQGDGSRKPETVDIGEGTYDPDVPGLKFNIWDSPMKLPYTMFGPPVYRDGGGVKTDEAGNVSDSTVKVADERKVVGKMGIDLNAPAVTSTVVPPGPESTTRGNKEKEGGQNNYNVSEEDDDGGDEDDDENDSDDANKNTCATNIRKRVPIVQAIGLKPAGCILVRDNWCGFEVPSYTGEEGCWAVSSAVLDNFPSINGPPH